MEFVTGGTGLVGRYLVAELVAGGREIRLLCRPQSDREALLRFLNHRGLDGQRVEWCEGDLLDGSFMEEAIAGCSRVYHLAAVVSFHPKDAQHMMRINRDATRILVNAMLHVGVEELVHLSSVAALGRVTGEPVHEEVPFESGPNVTAYAHSKFESELEVWRGQEEGLKVLTLNPTVILGAGDFNRSSSALFAMVYKGLKWHPTGSNGFVAAHDVARACHVLGDQKCWGKRYLLNAENRSYQSVFDQMADDFKIPRPSRPVKPWMMGAVWRLSMALEFISGKRAKATKESVATTHKNHSYQSDRLEKTLGEAGIVWKYQSINAVISETARICKEQLGSN